MSENKMKTAKPLPEEARKSLRVVLVNEGESKLYNSLGITEERSKELSREVAKLMRQEEELSKVFAVMSQKVENANEFAVVMFATGDLHAKLQNPLAGILSMIK